MKLATRRLVRRWRFRLQPWAIAAAVGVLGWILLTHASAFARVASATLR